MSRLFRLSRPNTLARHGRSLKRRKGFSLNLEVLEDRALLSAIITVNSETDEFNQDDGTLSLREAIAVSNGDLSVPSLSQQEQLQVSGDPTGTDPNTIIFNIPGSGVQTIAPTSDLGALPAITHPVTINGYSQSGSQMNTSANQDNAVLTIQLDGSLAGFGANGLTIQASDVVVQGLIISNFSGAGISIEAGSGSKIQGNFIGTDATGTMPQGNATDGVEIFNSTNNTIGGTTPADRNLISGNGTTGLGGPGVLIEPGASGNRVQGNFIGTDAMAITSLGNGSGSIAGGVDIEDAPNNIIGGTVSSGASNLISGNHGFGISIVNPDATGNVVQGNFIGTDFGSGTLNGVGFRALGNGGGVLIQDAPNNMIGGTVPNEEGNLIAASLSSLSSSAGGIGVTLQNPSASGNQVLGNSIGPPLPTGSSIGSVVNLGNDGGGVLINGAPNNTIGGAAGNLIAANGGSGVAIISSATGNQVLGNQIGTDPMGRVAPGNAGDGVLIADSPRNTIGGATGGMGNLIATNNGNGVNITGSSATNNVVQGNLIGLSAAEPLGNAANGVNVTSPSNTIGGTAQGAGNVISNNRGAGIVISGSGAMSNLIQGNKIGTDAAGGSDSRQGNQQEGIVLDGASGNVVGGTTFAAGTGAGNIITDNRLSGIRITGGTTPASSNMVQGNLIGLDASGGSTGGNGLHGIFLDHASGNLIGGAQTGAGNVISANLAAGILINVGDTNQVQGNFIGTDASGTRAVGNTSDGVSLTDASGNTIGGTLTVARNLIAGNLNGVTISGTRATDNLILGDLIGTDATGSKPLRNARDGVFVDAARNTIGGTAPGARNVIAGNGLNGIDLTANASQILVQGNYIGVDATGSSLLGNASNGVLSNGPDVTIGGPTAAARNIISGNGASGIQFSGVSATRDVVQGNYIGLDAGGTVVLGNIASGVFISGAPENVIGGNVISGNGTGGVLISGMDSRGNQVLGNLIGTDATGTLARGNGQDGLLILDAPGNTVGGSVVGAGNTIAGNLAVGVEIRNSNATGNAVLGNLIGTDISGLRALGNIRGGVLIVNAPDNQIGGSMTGQERNIISGNGSTGIEIQGGSASSNVVAGNDIGTDVNGTASLGNGGDGVLSNASGTTIGGTAAGARNVVANNEGNGITIALNASFNLVQANFIGIDLTGSPGKGNQLDGILVEGASNNAIGDNVIAGNGLNGIEIRFATATGNTVAGNLIGTDPSGTRVVANGGDGVNITVAPSNTIGGSTPGQRNIIAGNNGHGITISSVNPGVPGQFSAVVIGNSIGTDVTGNLPLGNSQDGILVANSSGVLIGEPNNAMRNIVAGNDGAGVQLLNATNVAVMGNFIGTNAAGNIALPNAVGVIINSGIANVIGGSTLTPGQGAGNLISGNTNAGIEIFGQNSKQNLVQGNLIGTDLAGATALSNTVGVILIDVAGNTIGGASAMLRNLISGNTSAGIYLFDRGTTGNQVLGNFIGTNLDGTRAIDVPQPLNSLLPPRQNLGVFLNDAPSNQIGDLTSGVIGGAPGARNLISGNVVGVEIAGAIGRGNVIGGNFLGTDVTGRRALANQVGVFINNAGAGVSVGGGVTTAGNLILRNVVSGNSNTGVQLLGTAATGNVIQGNYIGTDASGSVALPGQTQTAGIFIQGSPKNTIGGPTPQDRNVIAGNAGTNGLNSAGVYFFAGAAGNVVRGNFIGTDATGNKVIGNGAYGVLLFNAPNNSVDRSNSGNNRLKNKGIAAFREFTGPVTSGSSSQSSQTSGRVRVRVTGHPVPGRPFVRLAHGPRG